MTQFDPDTATEAWLATLSSADHARAIAYTHGQHWLLLWGTMVAIAAAFIILRSGLLARAAAWANAKRPRPNRAVLYCALAFCVLDALIELPWSIYVGWWRERSYGLTQQPFGGWLGDSVLSAGIGALMTVMLALALYALMRRALTVPDSRSATQPM